MSGRQGLGDDSHGCARSLFWILAGIEIGIAAVWLAINAASLDSWFAELVKRIMFIGLFAFILDRGPAFAKAVVDSLYQIGAGGGSASPANIFDAAFVSRPKCQNRRNLVSSRITPAIAAVFAMVVVVVCFSLVAAIFVSVMVEMYVGLLAGMIMLGLGRYLLTKDFAIKYLVYAFSVGMKLMALVMIAKIGSDILLGLAEAPTATSEQFYHDTGDRRDFGRRLRHRHVSPADPAGRRPGRVGLWRDGNDPARWTGRFNAAAPGSWRSSGQAGLTGRERRRAGGSSLGAAALRGMEAHRGAAGAVGSAAKEKAIGRPAHMPDRCSDSRMPNSTTIGPDRTASTTAIKRDQVIEADQPWLDTTRSHNPRSCNPYLAPHATNGTSAMDPTSERPPPGGPSASPA